jgi:hypothetical protein
MTDLTNQQILANNIIKNHPFILDAEIQLPEDTIQDYFQVTFSGIIFNCYCRFHRRTMPCVEYYTITIKSDDLIDKYDECYIFCHKRINVTNKDDDSYTKIMKMLEWNKNILNDLVYDNKIGQLIDTECNKRYEKIQEVEDNRMSYMGNMIFSNQEECCVCYEKTNSKTECGHSICLRCATKLKNEQWVDGDEDIDDNGNDADKKCPMCRKWLKMEQY